MLCASGTELIHRRDRIALHVQKDGFTAFGGRTDRRRLREIGSHRLDALGPMAMSGCHSRRFFDDELCVGSRSAAPVRTLEQFLARGDVKIQISPGRGNEVDDVLLSLGRTRRIVLTVPHFSNALAVVARSEL